MSGSRDNYITPAESDCLAQIECERTTAKQVNPSFFKSNYVHNNEYHYSCRSKLVRS